MLILVVIGLGRAFYVVNETTMIWPGLIELTSITDRS